jgi:hypothetical protein
MLPFAQHDTLAEIGFCKSFIFLACIRMIILGKAIFDSRSGGKRGGFGRLVRQAGFVHEKAEGPPYGPARLVGHFLPDEEAPQPELPFGAVGAG